MSKFAVFEESPLHGKSEVMINRRTLQCLFHFVLMTDLLNRLQNDSRGMKIDFDVYPADKASSFKKNKPGKPFVRMCVQRYWVIIILTIK